MRRLAFSLLLLLGSCTNGRNDAAPEVDPTIAKLRAIPAFAAQLRPSLRLVRTAEGHRLATSAWQSAQPTLDATIAADHLHLALAAEPGFTLDVRGDDAVVAGRVVDGSVIFADVQLHTDLVQSLAPESAEELRVLRAADAPHTLRWRIEKGPAVSALRVREGRVEALDAAGAVRITSQPMFAIDAEGVRRDLTLRVLLGAGDESFVVETVVPHTMTPPIVVDPSWTATGSMLVRRHYHMIAPILGAQVLVAGGEGSAGGLSSAEIYSESTKTWTSTTSMSRVRTYGVMTPLADGRALVVGNAPGDPSKVGEVYEPTGKTWTLTSVAPADRRVGLTLTRLTNGKVLVAGGDVNPGNVFDTADLYDPSNNTWTPTGTMATERALHTATMLADGRVLVAGGSDDSVTISLAEIYDPATGLWSNAAPMGVPRRSHAAARLGNGRVLVCGGTCPHAGCPSSIYASCERYDPATNTWSAAGSMSSPREELALIAFGGRAVAAGGQNVITPLFTADLYDPVANGWTADDPMANGRHAPAAVLLTTGEMLIAGGRASSTSISQTAEIHAVPGAVDGGVADTSTSDGGAAADTNVVVVDTSSTDTKGTDSTATDTTATDTTVTDTATQPDTGVSTADSLPSESSPEDTSASDGSAEDALGDAPDDAIGTEDTGTPGGPCVSNADCPVHLYCASAGATRTCAPREPRGEAPCGCSVPGADVDGPARAAAAMSLLVATVCVRRRRRNRGHSSRPSRT